MQRRSLIIALVCMTTLGLVGFEFLRSKPAISVDEKNHFLDLL